jgi:hypothetical protein
MREVLAHTPGRIFAAVLLLSTAGLVAGAWFLDRGILVLGWMPLPFALGLAFVAVWLAACSAYLFKYWPYR